MYISKIELKNMRCFDELVLELDRHKRSALITGDNGTGKSTLLRSIAMCLCDQSSAAALFRELKGSFIRKGKEKEGGHIDLYLYDGPNKKYLMETRIHSIGTLESLTQVLYRGHKKIRKNKIEQHDFPWHRIFATGYGAGARTLGAGTIESYVLIDAVYTLFRYDEPLQNPEIALRRLVDDESSKGKKNGKDVKEIFLALLRRVCNLGPNSRVYLTKKGIEVKGPWGRTGLDSLGDGYKATITMVLDLIGRRMLYGRTLNPEKMSGIVLLDEVEQHLHPQWQLNALDLLTKTFPNIQFIATTHSPLVVTGTQNVPVYAFDTDLRLGSTMSGREIYGWQAEDVYRDVYDLSSSRPSLVMEDIARFRELDRKRLTQRAKKDDLNELRRLRNKLRKLLHGSDPEVLTIRLENLKRYLQEREDDI